MIKLEFSFAMNSLNTTTAVNFRELYLLVNNSSQKRTYRHSFSRRSSIAFRLENKIKQKERYATRPQIE